jgi:hypothetical protein
MSGCGAEGRPRPSARVGDNLRYSYITTSCYPLRNKPFINEGFILFKSEYLSIYNQDSNPNLESDSEFSAEPYCKPESNQ